MARVGEALVGAHVRGAVNSQVVGARDPSRERSVEFGQTVNMAAFESQRGFEVALDRADEAFDFTFAPGVVGLGVQKPDAEVGAHSRGPWGGPRQTAERQPLSVRNAGAFRINRTWVLTKGLPWSV